MNESRREICRALAGAAILFVLPKAGDSAQNPAATERTGSSQNIGDPPGAMGPAARDKITLQEYQKDMKKNVQRLFQLASELKDQVEKTDATTVLSMAMVRKAEEIEKLAKQIKDRAKGS